MKLVQVTWIDAVGGDGWLNIQELRKETPVIHYSVGYVIVENDKQITLSMSHNDDFDNMGAWLAIPREYIKNIRRIKL